MIEKYSGKVIVSSFQFVISSRNIFFFMLTPNFYYFTIKIVHLPTF